MTAPFAHLRVASGYSFRHGASHPEALVTAAASQGMDVLALTDRDGLYGAVRFVKACLEAGISPVIGTDLAVSAGELPIKRPTPVKGGRIRDERHPRAVVTAISGDGWGTLCELVTAVNLKNDRFAPVAVMQDIVSHCRDRDVMVMLGADSRVGELIAERDFEGARDEAARWREAMGDQLVLAVTNHRVGGNRVASARQAAGMLRLGRRLGLKTVLTNMVRMVHPRQAATVDVLDAARRLVPLGAHNVDRRNLEGYLKPGLEMEQVAEEVAHLAGESASGLLGRTRELANECRLDPVADLGLGRIRLPDFETLGTTRGKAAAVLRARCEAGVNHRYGFPSREVTDRLAEELAVIAELGIESYFLTVADVVTLIKDMGVRCAARGSGAGSLVNHLLGISGVEPMAEGLIMERFLSPLRMALPDIDLDVESHRRTEVYKRILDRFGEQRVACVAMLGTYRVRHAVRDVGAALSLPPAEVDAIAKAFPHIRARDARAALQELPELRTAGLTQQRLEVLFELVESLDGLPRHVALHPCGILLGDSSLRRVTPVVMSSEGFPTSQFDKDDVEDLGLLKLDVLGVRMQSAMSHALTEIGRIPAAGTVPDIDSLSPFDDEDTYEMIRNRETLGCFQIESPGQRELLGKFGPETFTDLVIDISLFRPGPVKSDMVTPFLEARQGWRDAEYLHPSFIPALAETHGVVVFHEQITKLIAVAAGCSLAEGEDKRRALGDRDGQREVHQWLWPRMAGRGYEASVIEKLWSTLVSFASFGFCKAHAAAFALPTYQSAWLKRHYPAHFLAGILTHHPGMYPKRLLLEEARRIGVAILGLDINHSHGTYRVEQLRTAGMPPSLTPGAAERWGVRLALSDVKGISTDEIDRILAGRPYESLSDFWFKTGVSAPVVENLLLAGAFDSCYGIETGDAVRNHRQVTRRDLLLAVADLQRLGHGKRGRNSRSSKAPALQQAFDFGEPGELDVVVTGLPEMDADERLRAELEVLGLDASSHIMERHLPMLRALGVVSSRRLLQQRNNSEILVAGVKVATQTPPVRSGKRVIFLTVDDSTGPVDVAFFEDVQGQWATAVFSNWLLLVRGIVRRTGPRGVSLRATGAWDLGQLHQSWARELEAGKSHDEAALALEEMLLAPKVARVDPVADRSPEGGAFGASKDEKPGRGRSGGMGRRRVLVHTSGFRQSPYADVKPAGVAPIDAPRKLWHSSPGSSGH